MNTTTQRQEQAHEEIPAGIYRAKAVAGSEQYGITSNGNDQIGIDLQLLDLNRTVTTVLVFSERSEKFSTDRLKALGWTEGSDSLAGIDRCEVQAQIRYDVFTDSNGQPKRVMKVEIMTGGGRFRFEKPMSEQQKRGFFARLNQIAGAPRAAGAAGAPSGQPAPGGGYPKDWDAPPRVDLG